MITKPKICYIILLNWNNWHDTIFCLESIFRNNYSYFKVIVCDNNSTDGSISKIINWAEGKLIFENENKNILTHLYYPPIKKPITYIKVTNNGFTENTNYQKIDSPLTLIQTGGNLGFSGGINVGIKHILNTKKEFEYIWILNNDSLIDEYALSSLINTADCNPKVGIVSSVLYDFYNPTNIQEYGGGYINFFSGKLNVYKKPIIKLKKHTYLTAASMLIRRKVIESVGLFNENYFLYWDDVDYSIRVNKKWKLKIDVNSKVYHKLSATVGKRSLKQDFYFTASSIFFFKNNNVRMFFFPIFFSLFTRILKRIFLLNWKSLITLIRGARAGFSIKKINENSFF